MSVLQPEGMVKSDGLLPNAVAMGDRACEPVSLTGFVPSPEATASLPQAAARRLCVVPMALTCDHRGQCLTVACADTTRADLTERLSRQLLPGTALRLRKASASEVAAALEKCYQPTLSSEQILLACAAEVTAREWLSQTPDAVIRLLESLLLSATRQGASDIHLSPDDHALCIRFRIDGVLHFHARLCVLIHSALLVRLKVMAEIDIAETRRAQDGQFTQLIDARAVNFRVACFPTRVGQNIVLRVLDQERRHDTLPSLGLSLERQAQLQALMQQPEGLFLVCGPTGSGKSNTLHALLAERDLDALNVMTLEDPVELIVPKVRQTSIDAVHAMSFAQGVRGLLRQDPDVLMIGEVRDKDSCAMAFRAAMSGHQVLTSVHAASALAALSRLRELGASPGQLAENLTAIAALRLVRKKCLACNTSGCDEPARHDQPACCEVCRGTGFRGRQLLMELLVVTPELSALIASDSSPETLLHCAWRQGFLSLRQEAQALIEQGVTSAREIHRVLGEGG